MINNNLGKKRDKPTKIVVYEKNENNETVRQIVEKKRKRKITALKKAIMRKRENKILNKEKVIKPVAKIPKDKFEDEDSNYETVDETEKKEQLENFEETSPSVQDNTTMNP